MIAFSLAAVGIKRIFPIINDNQDSLIKTSEEIHSQENLQHFCAPVIHPTMGKIITSYKYLANDPELKEVWETGFVKDWGSLAQGDKITGSIGTYTFMIIFPDQVLLIPNDCVITYANIIIEYIHIKKTQTASGSRLVVTASYTLAN